MRKYGYRDYLENAAAINKSIASENFKDLDLSSLNLRNANLRGANLAEVPLRGANLEGAILAGANLERADLSGAKLSKAHMHGAVLTSATLCSANMEEADLSFSVLNSANLMWAKMAGANLYQASMHKTNMLNADISGANFTGACIAGSSLRCTKITDKTIGLPSIRCPDAGAFDAWKKCRGNIIVKIRIPENARRSSATTNQCRAEHVEVLEVLSPTGEARSGYDANLIYREGASIRCTVWEEDRWAEHVGGIHFFMTREEAEQYHL